MVEETMLNQMIGSASLSTLAISRRPRFFRHTVGNAADRITHIVGRRFDIALR